MNKEKDDWTKEELSLRSGPKELAKAVIKQWHKDGEPESDREAIKYWYSILQEANK